MPGEHELQIALATALRERDEARAAMEAMKNRDYAPLKKWIEENAPDAVQRAYWIMVKAEQERDALRTEVKRLREAFMGLRETYGLVLAFAREVLGVIERGEQAHVMRVPDRTVQLLRCKDPIPTADDVLADARAALCTGGDRG